MTKLTLACPKLDDVFPRPASSCTDCFVCKFPEFRFLWFVAAIAVQLLSPDNFNVMFGNVTQQCMTNGSFYKDVLCGPRGSEYLPFHVWKKRHPHGYSQFDIDIVQSFAAEMLHRGKQLGGAAGGKRGELAIETAKSWFLRDPTVEEPAARFTYLMCMLWRESDAGAGIDESPEKYADFADGSIAQITSRWAFESCKR